MRKIKILIVDDYKENISALSELIASENVEIFSAMNAEQALELIYNHDFGLALLDVQMPVTNGFELAKTIRSVKKYRTLPIIFVTAHREDSSVLFEGYQSGAVDLLFKPLDTNMVRSKVRVFVELAEQKALLENHVDELKRLQVEAEAANIAKSQFLANMSHEIRTPLAAVMGFADLIARGASNENEKQELAAAVQRNGQLLLRLIDDILDISKIEANKLEIEKAEFDLQEVIRDIDSILSLRAHEKGIRLCFGSFPSPSTHYNSDATRIKQILLNIIGNAIKFTNQGSVQVNFSLEPAKIYDSKLVDRFTVIVKDDGIGLTPDQADRLFKPFTQGDSSTRRQFGGSGLGLVISRQIARALGGDVQLVSSVPQQGSAFKVEILLEPFDKKETPPRLEKKGEKNKLLLDKMMKLKGKSVLAVDDSEDNLTLISMYLKDLGVHISYAENGFRALQEVKNKKFDLILMDVQMPGMDGHETTEQIRRLGFKNPIIALTAHAIRSEHERCKKAGCTNVLTKPINQKTLIRELQTYLC